MSDDLKEFAGILFLTDREYEMFKAIGQGLTPREIAAIKGHRISTSTISKYYERLANKLGTQNWRQTFRLAVRYECMRLKRIAVVPQPPQYMFVQEIDRLDQHEQSAQ